MSKEDVSIGKKGVASDAPPFPALLEPLRHLGPCIHLNFSLDGSWFPSPQSASPYPCPFPSQGPQILLFPGVLATSKQECGFLVYFGLFSI